MLERGDQIGDYTLVRFLGRGQFGEVWLAEKQLQFSKRKFQHALKFLFNLGDEINLKSAEAEIDTWIEASGHPNVMSVLDMLVHNEHIIIASEFAESGSLKDWLNQSGGKAPSHQKALEMMTGILNGIEHLHSRNVVHRDLKPDNILLQGSFPRITDFGISRIVSAGSMSTVAMGSPFYMSPESFDGSKSTQTDIWSAGVILYEMLTGEHPYRSETIYGLVSAIRQAEPKPLPEYIPAELRNVVETALQKDLSKRYPSAQAMRSAVELEIHKLKVRLSQSGDPFMPSHISRVEDPAATLVNEYFDNSVVTAAARIDVPAPAVPEPDVAETEAFNIAELPETTPLAEYVRKAPTPDALVSAVPPSQSASERAKSAIEKFNEAVDLEYRNSLPPRPAPTPITATPPVSLETSQSPHKKNSLMVIGGVLAAGFVICLIAIIALAFAARAIFFSSPGGDTNTVSTNANSKAVPSVPTPPKGMAYIDGGEFTMGRDTGGIPEEQPSHRVTVPPFFMDIYEVTNEQYAEFVTGTGQRAPQAWRNNTFPGGQENYPVVGVNWNDADAFAKWKGKRLPTEEEWEFAARGKNSFLYPWGNEWAPKLANADGASRSFAEVGKFKGASPYGIYDMVGNAGEWTASDFGAYPGGNLSGYYADKIGLKTRRGCDYDSKKEFATTTFRFGYAPTGADYNLTGFRCAKDIGN